MPEDKKKLAVGVGIVAGLGALIYLATKAEAEPEEPEPGLSNLYGVVIGSITGSPIPNVFVVLNGYATHTNDSGYYQFLDLEPGSYTAEFSKEGYERAGSR